MSECSRRIQLHDEKGIRDVGPMYYRQCLVSAIVQCVSFTYTKVC